ncbi:site-specific recombinase XerD [Thermocatellispora tengchongensis]|uniref:Site-specific recombinase XerD n=1 Tax=Thermocatellispora tengchongensis TaxID=1073253 RepID=A0A840PGH6_9ACTN|nr:tyrosine-type recombinase/integrase [Thermocatellispora tengchongensis]MBB5137043.1 site-specific recombinase XerD [Thermocatellispora tengchongensis]
MRPAELNRLTVVEAADRYVELVRARTLTGALSPATAEVYARDVATFVALAGADRVLDDLDGADVDAVLLAFARKPDGRRAGGADGDEGGGARQSAASQARFRRSVSALFKHAVLAGWVQVNPMTAATVTARERGGLRPERRALTREQAQGLIGAARGLAGDGAGVEAGRRRDQRTGLRDGLIVLLLATVGPRVSELVRANVEDFYTNDGVRYWRIFGKGGRTRDVPLPGDVARVLDVYLAEGRGVPAAGGDGEKALLLSWRGRRLARGDVQAVIDRVLRRVDPARRRSVTPHGLRHTTATHLLADAVDMDAVRRVLGHSDLATLGRYRDELPGELEVAMRAHPLLRE